MRNFQDYLERKKSEYGDKFDASDLSKKFIPYFENGKRIEVETMGEIKRGTVGVTTGWKPVFLLMLKSNSISSSYTLSDKDSIIRKVA